MTTPAEMQALVEKMVVNMGRFNGFINGPASGSASLVEVDGLQEVPTISRAIQQILVSSALDGTDPLQIKDFIAGAGGDHTAGLQAAVNVLFAETGVYRRYLDLQGITLTITAPIVVPACTNAVRFIGNGQIETTAAVWGGAGNYLLDADGVGVQGFLSLVNVRMAGGGVANWIIYDNLSLTLANFSAGNNRSDGTSGIVGGVNGPLTIRGAEISAPDAALLPAARNRRGIDLRASGNHIIDLTANFFRVSLLLRGLGDTLVNPTINQGTTSPSPISAYTPGIRFTAAAPGSTVLGMTAIECFVEIANEHAPGATALGALAFIGGRMVANSATTSLAFFRAADYSSLTTASVRDFRVSGMDFTNTGTAEVRLTALANPANFNPRAHTEIYMQGNTFQGQVVRQANPIAVAKTFGSVLQHVVDFTGILPFEGMPNYALGLTGVASGNPSRLDVGSINRNNRIVRVDSASNWAGDITVHVTMNFPDSNGVVGT